MTANNPLSTLADELKSRDTVCWLAIFQRIWQYILFCETGEQICLEVSASIFDEPPYEVYEKLELESSFIQFSSCPITRTSSSSIS